MEKILEEMEDLHKRDRLFKQKTLGQKPVFFPPDCQRLYDRDRQHQLEARLEKFFQNTDYLDIDGPTSSSAKALSKPVAHPTPPKILVDPDEYQAIMKDTKDASSKINNVLARIREHKEILKHKLDTASLQPLPVVRAQKLSTAVTQTEHPSPPQKLLKEDATQTSAKKVPTPLQSQSSSASLTTVSSSSTIYQSLPTDHGYLVDLNEALTESRMNSFDLEDIDDSMVTLYHQKLLQRASKSKFPDSSHFPAQSSDIDETSFAHMQSLPSSISFGDSASKEAPEQDISLRPQPKPIHISPLKEIFKPYSKHRGKPSTDSPKNIFPPLTIPKTVWAPDDDSKKEQSSFKTLDKLDNASEKIDSSSIKASPGSSESTLSEESSQRAFEVRSLHASGTVDRVSRDFRLPQHIWESAGLETDLSPEEYDMLLEHLSKDFSQRRRPPTTPRMVDFGEMLIPTELSTIPELDSHQASLIPSVHVPAEENKEDLDTAVLEESSSNSTLVAESSAASHTDSCPHSLNSSLSSQGILASLVSSATKSSESCVQGRIISQSTPIRPRIKSESNILDEPQPSLLSFDISSIRLDGAQEELTPVAGRSPALPSQHPLSSSTLYKSFKETTSKFHGLLQKNKESPILTRQQDPAELKTPTKSTQNSSQFFALEPISTPSALKDQISKVQLQPLTGEQVKDQTSSQFVPLDSFHSTPVQPVNQLSRDNFVQPSTAKPPCKTFPDEGSPFYPLLPDQSSNNNQHQQDSDHFVALDPLSSGLSTPRDDAPKEVRFEESSSKSSELFTLQPDSHQSVPHSHDGTHRQSSRNTKHSPPCSKQVAKTIFASQELHISTSTSCLLLPISHSQHSENLKGEFSNGFFALQPDSSVSSSSPASQNRAVCSKVSDPQPTNLAQNERTPISQPENIPCSTSSSTPAGHQAAILTPKYSPPKLSWSDEFQPLEPMESGSSSQQQPQQQSSGEFAMPSQPSSSSFTPLRPDETSEGPIEQNRMATPSHSGPIDSMTDSLVSFVKHEQSILASTSSSDSPPSSWSGKRLPKKADFRQRTKRLWNNLEEVQERKEAEARKEAANLNRQRMKEYSNRIKAKTPKKK